MKVENWPLEKIIPYARNPRNNDNAVDDVAASIKEFGPRQCIVVDKDGVIIAGHTRLKAAKKLGLTEFPVHVAEGLTKAQIKAYRLADNKVSEKATWDNDMLKLELEELSGMDFQMDGLGFDPAELDAMMGMESCNEKDDEPQIDKGAELAEKWGVKRGQLWQLGNHRLLCGDSTSKEDVENVMQGEKAELCFTSPPYGQQRDYRDEATALVQDWDGLMNGVFGNLPMSESGQVLVNLGMIHIDGEWAPYWDKWIENMRSQGWKRFGWYVWDKLSGRQGDWHGRFAPSHEFVFHFNKKAVQPVKWVATQEASQKRGKPKKDGAEKGHKDTTNRNKDGTFDLQHSPDKGGQLFKIPDNVIRMRPARDNVEISHLHPAIFPIPFVSYFLKSWPGTVFEPFSGSGTTIMACEQLGRKCRAIEISPAYVAVAIQRWADVTGGEPRVLA